MENEDERMQSKMLVESPNTIFTWLRLWLFEQAHCEELFLQPDNSNMERQL